jgi:hypothetical protein
LFQNFSTVMMESPKSGTAACSAKAVL